MHADARFAIHSAFVSYKWSEMLFRLYLRWVRAKKKKLNFACINCYCRSLCNWLIDWSILGKLSEFFEWKWGVANERKHTDLAYCLRLCVCARVFCLRFVLLIVFIVPSFKTTFSCCVSCVCVCDKWKELLLFSDTSQFVYMFSASLATFSLLKSNLLTLILHIIQVRCYW